MESAVKLDNSNSGPLPQRQQRGNQANKNIGKHAIQKQNDSDGSPAEKKARFGGQNNQNGGLAGGGGAAAGSIQNQNKNFPNKGGFAANRNRNRGGNQNRPNFQGQNQTNPNVSLLIIIDEKTEFIKPSINNRSNWLHVCMYLVANVYVYMYT